MAVRSHESEIALSISGATHRASVSHYQPLYANNSNVGPNFRKDITQNTTHPHTMKITLCSECIDLKNWILSAIFRRYISAASKRNSTSIIPREENRQNRRYIEVSQVEVTAEQPEEDFEKSQKISPIFRYFYRFFGNFQSSPRTGYKICPIFYFYF